MPPKRRPPETDAPTNPNSELLGRSEALPPAAQPAPVKRQRVSRACDQCRAARERCDGKQPRCYPCISQSRPCTYEVSPKKRGVQTGYIRTLELALGWVFEKVPGSEETLSTLLARPDGQGPQILAGKDPGGADHLQKRWRKSRVHRGIDRILSGEAAPSPGQEVSPFAEGSDTEGDAIRGCADSIPVAPDTETAPQESPSSRRMSSGRGPPITPSNEALRAERPQQMSASGMSQFAQVSAGRVKLPSNHWRLLDIYFSYTHSWLPILEKQDIFQASYLYSDHGLAIDSTDPSFAVHAELWAALALASLQDAASSQPSSSDGADPSPTEIYEIARGLLPAENGPFQVHHARAFLLLGLVNLAQDKLPGAALLTGSAIRVLLDPETAQRGAQDRGGQRMNLALISCFIVDTILSVRCSAPPHLRVEDLSGLPLVSEGGHDQWEPWTPCDGFGAGNMGSRSSRSSAFCLSTFNQIYAIIKVVARETSRNHGSVLGGGSSMFVTALQQAIDANLPFGNFILSPTCGTTSVPTPYVARATYLWARALAEPGSETFLPLLLDTLEQYQRHFGRSSTPPFISACVAAFANEEYLVRCSEQSRQVLRGLVSTHSSRGFQKTQSSSARGAQPISLFPSTHDSLEMPNSARFSAPNNPMMSYPTPMSLGPSTTPHQQPHTANRGYPSFLAPGVASAYQQPPFTNSPVALSQGGNMHMPHPGTAGMGGMSGVGTNMGSTQHDHHASPTLNIPPLGFGHSPDYDALLDDLASIERADAVDLDTQFMTNLGFAPGCDINEILTRNFGAV